MNPVCRVLTALLLVVVTATPDDPASGIDALFREYDRPGVPGASVMVIKDGKVLHRKAYGLANLEEPTPSTTRTNYRLASVTKQFTAMAILILAERKKLSLDDRLTDFFADFPAYGRQITVRHLLQHTSGLTAYEGLIPKGTTRPLKDRDVLGLLKQQEKTSFTPGSEFRYSNSGYALLALIVEAASRRSFADFLRRNIFEPLGMRRTVAYEAGISTVPHRAYGYSRRGDGFERTDQSLTSAVLGDGGVYSSVEDLSKWDEALGSNKLVRASTLDQAVTPGVLADGRRTEYGFGWFLGSYRGVKSMGHGGSTIGFRTAIERFPERRLTVIILTNRNEADPAALARRVADLYLFKAR
jgi:CubicO group peptidase (beta-lactamase class C family)